MNIALKIKSWSFYLDSKFIYCNGVVLEKQIVDTNNKNYHLFQSIEVGDQISLKYASDTPNLVLDKFSNIVLVFSVTDSEVTRDKNSSSVKFLFNSVEKCAILPEV